MSRSDSLPIMPLPRVTTSVRQLDPAIWGAAIYERWPGYEEQSWRERFEELDRRYSEIIARRLNEEAANDEPANDPERVA